MNCSPSQFERSPLPVPSSLSTRVWGAVLLVGLGAVGALAALPEFEFSAGADAAQWQAQHDLADFGPGPEGLRMTITGNDPYFAGPPRDYPADTPLWLYLRLRSDQGGMAQVFYFRTAPTEADSARFSVPAGGWYEAKVRLPPLGPGCRLRLDPPGAGGVCVVARLRFEERRAFEEPKWPQPAVPELGADAVAIESGELRLVHGRGDLGEFEIQVNGRRMACGNSAPLVGYVRNGAARWFRLGGAGSQFRVIDQPLQSLADAQVGGRLSAQLVCTDPDGARWEVEQTFRLNAAGSLAADTTVRVDQDRDVLHLPLLTVLPGLGSFGTNKTQALLAGVEYLANEPSSSTADLNPPGSDRQVPDTLKLTAPLMVVAADGHYVGIAWNREQATNVCAVFDTPDRFFHSGAQMMGLLYPGSDGFNREENSLLPYDTARLRAGRALTVSALLLGGRGATVIPAVRDYVRFFGLCPLPEVRPTPSPYYAQAARGWLDSRIREGDRYRHAAPGFGAMPAADAGLFLDWLAGRVDDPALAGRLIAAAPRALAGIAPSRLNGAQVGHVRSPAPALAYRHTADNAEAARDHGRGLLTQFRADGTVRYVSRGDGLDYARTHWTDHANGLTATSLAALLEAAAFSGDRSLMDDGVRRLRQAITNYHGTVPRGAQTWEIPLHTPDILASARLVHAFVLGYELSAAPEFLAEAKYWAWTGVPFVYLTPPTPQAVGAYATIPVLGATAWVAPNWIGLPVQWCGLVYADALYRLAEHDSSGPWRQLAEGITLSGIQQSYPPSDTDFVGLLPDSYNLRPQSRNGPNINPATVLAPASLWRQDNVYDRHAFLKRRWMVHVPGRIEAADERTDGATFTVRGWPKGAYQVLVVGLTQPPRVRINGARVPLAAPHLFQPAEGRLILELEGRVTIEFSLPATDAD